VLFPGYGVLVLMRGRKHRHRLQVTETEGCGYLWWHAHADADAGAEAVLLTGVAHARGGRLGAMQVLGSKATVGSCADCRLPTRLLLRLLVS
jgi:hypothetical protein